MSSGKRTKPHSYLIDQVTTGRVHFHHHRNETSGHRDDDTQIDEDVEAFENRKAIQLPNAFARGLRSIEKVDEEDQVGHKDEHVPEANARVGYFIVKDGLAEVTIVFVVKNARGLPHHRSHLFGLCFFLSLFMLLCCC